MGIHKKNGIVLVVVGLFFLGFGQFTAVTLAQSIVTAEVDGQTTNEGSDALELTLFLELLDESGRALPAAGINSGTVLLTNGTQYPAQFEKNPATVALILDASGSMEAAFPAAQQAAIDLVQAAEADSTFALFTFREDDIFSTEFTTNKNQIISAINQTEIVGDGICLFDVAAAAGEALDQLAADTVNLSLVFFSDGENNEPCTAVNSEDFLAYAAPRNNHIYAVVPPEGDDLRPAPNLNQLAQATGGFVTTNETADLQTIIDTFNNHWTAQASLTPTQGTQRGTLLINLENGDLVTPAPLLFTSTQNYYEEPEVELPVQIEIGNFRYDQAEDIYGFTLFLTNVPEINTVHIETIDSEDNIQVELTSLANPASEQQLFLPTTNLEPDKSYVLRVFARDTTGTLIKDGLETVQATHPFRYAPPLPLSFSIESIAVKDEPAKLNLQAVRIENDTPELKVQLNLENAEAVAKVNGRLLNLDTNQASGEFDVNLTLENNIPTAYIPVDIEEDTYTLVLSALAADGTRLATADEKFTYNAPEGLLGRAGLALQTNPILLLFFMLLIGIVSFYGWRLGHVTGKRRAATGKGLNLGSLDRDNGNETPPVISLTLVSSPDPALNQVGRWEINQVPFSLGREGCDLTISDDQHISRKHAQITFADGDYFIEDLGSSNGTFLNATQLVPHEPISMRQDRGMRIRIGKTTTFLFGESSDTNNMPET